MSVWELIIVILACFGIFTIVVITMVVVSKGVIDFEFEELKKEINDLNIRIEKLEKE